MPCLETWCHETFLGKPFDSGDDRQLTSYVLGGTKHYVDPQERVWKVKYCESAVVSTDVPSKLGQFIKQQIRWKKSWVRAFVFTLPFFYKDRSPFVVASFYVQVAGSLIAPLMAFRSLVILPFEGLYLTPLSYLAGVLFIDVLFAIEYKLRNKDSQDRWAYRLLFSFLSIAILDWLIYYSLLTIRNNSWLTRGKSKQALQEKMVA
jgi:hyaluronan synthase